MTIRRDGFDVPEKIGILVLGKPMGTSKRVGRRVEQVQVALSRGKSHSCDKAVRWQRKSRADRRQSLIDATIRVIAAYGISDCSLERVAAAAGVSHGLIRHYFGGKGALLVAAYQELADTFLATLDEAVRACDGDAMACLDAYVEVVHDPFVVSEDHALSWFGLWYEARSNPEVHAINREFQAQYLDYIENLVRMAATERGIDVDVQLVARGLVALTDGLWQELMIDHTAFGTQVAKEVCDDYLARHFDPGCKAKSRSLAGSASVSR